MLNVRADYEYDYSSVPEIVPRRGLNQLDPVKGTYSQYGTCQLSSLPCLILMFLCQYSEAISKYAEVCLTQKRLPLVSDILSG